MDKAYSPSALRTINSDPWASHTRRSTYSFSPEKAQFQQEQWLEKEKKLLKLYETQQSRALKSVGSGSEISSMPSGLSVGAGKVRYLFQSRRSTDENNHNVSVIGRDKSYPLKPLKKHSSSATNFARGKTFVERTPDWTVFQLDDLHQRSYSLDRYDSNRNQKNSFLNFGKNTRFAYGFDEQKPLISDRSCLGHCQSHLFQTENRNLTDNSAIHLPREMEGKFRNYAAQNIPFSKTQVGTSARGRKIEPLAKPTLKEMAPSEAKAGTLSSPVRKIRKSMPPSQFVASSTLLQKKTNNSREIKSPEKVASLAHPKNSTTPSAKSPMAEKNSLNLPPSSKTLSTPAADAHLSVNLINCRICGRSFASDRISKHEVICQKSKKSKRKPFDTLQQRVGGTEAEKFLKKPSKTTRGQVEEPKKPKNNWRKKHEEFIRNIRAAKEVSVHLKNGVKPSDLPPVPPSDYSDYIQCPHCSRKFNEAAAERHIPKCYNINFNKQKPGIRLQKNVMLKEGSKLPRQRESFETKVKK